MTEKTRNIAIWVVSGVLAAAFLLAGASKIFIDPAAAAEQFEKFGLPGWLAALIGLCEMSGGIGLLIPRLAALAASGLVIIMLGAIGSHVSHDPIANALPALVLGSLCTFVAWSRGVPFRRASA
jgi:putative oxidoreductase